MRLCETLHTVECWLVKDERKVKGGGDGEVGDIVVGRPNAAGCDYKVVVRGHAAHGFDNFGFVVGDGFNALQLLRERLVKCIQEGRANGAQRVGGGGVRCVLTIPRAKHHLAMYAEFVSTVFPPSTSSPMIKQAAVCIILEFLSSAVVDAMFKALAVPFVIAGYAADLCA